MRLGHQPYVKTPRPPVRPLRPLWRHPGRSRRGALFEYHLGELQASSGFVGEDVQKIKKAAAHRPLACAAAAAAVTQEELVQRNLRDSATAANDYFQNRPVRRLFLGGTAETVAQFREAA
ncbi:MAG: hypothetical protein IPK53_19450 [bacterium]|nr:hypothetical protein [bacterium]